MNLTKYSIAVFQFGQGAMLLCCSHASAQTAASTPVLHQEEQWTFGASLYGYSPPESEDYLQPTLTADRDWLHLEVRYNYEALHTGSAWFGYNFAGGDRLKWEFTPMFGGIFGGVSGVAPGYEGSLSWRALELYAEAEFVIDTADASASYFYNWSELTLRVLERWRVGVVAQHTHVYQTDREIQRGLLVGLSFGRGELTGYVFNPDDRTPTVVIALRASW
jgi:hypothetical protein